MNIDLIERVKQLYQHRLISLIGALQEIKKQTPGWYWDYETEQKIARMLMRKERGKKYD